MKAKRLLNPIVYSTEYFGHKNHYDQNKKLECTELFVFVQGMGTLV